MALLFMDGFDHYNPISYGYTKWDSNAPNGVDASYSHPAGRVNPNGGWIYVSNQSEFYWTKTLDGNYSTLIIGMGLVFGMQDGGSDVYFLAVYDGSTVQVGLRRNRTTGYIEAYRGDGTLLGTYQVAFSRDVWYHVELKATIHPSAGVLQFRVNEFLAIDLSGINTRNSSHSYANKFGIGTNYHRMHGIDDLYVCDDSGSENNDFLGDCRIDTVLPSGAGNYSQWTPSAGSNYQCVDDALFDGGTDYVSAATVGSKDSYACGNLPAGVSDIKALQVNVLAKRSDTAVITKVKPLVRIDGTDHEQAETTLGISYTDVRAVLETNPDTGLQWEKTDVDNAEFGQVLTYNPLP